MYLITLGEVKGIWTGEDMKPAGEGTATSLLRAEPGAG